MIGKGNVRIFIGNYLHMFSPVSLPFRTNSCMADYFLFDFEWLCWCSHVSVEHENCGTILAVIGNDWCNKFVLG